MGRLIKGGQGEALRATAQGEALWTTNTVKPSPVRATAIEYTDYLFGHQIAYALTGLEIAVIAPWGFAPR